MKTYRFNSLMAGLLYLMGTIFGIASAIFGGELMASLVQGDSLIGSNLLDLVVADSSKLILGSLFVLLMGISLVAMTIFLYPIFKKDSEELALGMLLFRGAMEGTWYFVTTASFLALVAMGSVYALDGANLIVLSAVGKVVYNFQDLLGTIGTMMFLIGATFLYISFYRTRLIPRWMSIWGLIGVIPYLAYALLHLFGIDNGIGLYLQMPLAIQEMIMALWLIIKGFNQLELKVLLSKENQL